MRWAKAGKLCSVNWAIIAVLPEQCMRILCVGPKSKAASLFTGRLITA